MAFRKQDWAVLLLYRLGYSRVRLFLNVLKNTPSVRILAFHDIPPGCEEGFAAKMKFLKAEANVISLDDYLDSKLSTKRLNVVLTFDDGYKSWIRTAAPVLRELQLPAIFFVSSGFVGLSEPDEQIFVQSKLKIAGKTTGSMSKEDLQCLGNSGFDIGGHTRNHVNLGSVRTSTEAMGEIAEDKNQLESIVGKEVKYFAYPFGACRNAGVDLENVLSRAGFHASVTTDGGQNGPDQPRHFLNRELTHAALPTVAFAARAFGAYDGVKTVRSFPVLRKLLQRPASDAVAAN
jgi:peptidoglycan/xylan/chitin deacetylase (PgdA/CDA1 family)